MRLLISFLFFFFQAEDGIRDLTVTGVQTCALPISYHVIRRVFDVAIPGEMQHDHEKNVLWWKEDPADETEWRLLKESVAHLKAARGRRKAPYVDTTAYVNWNAMMAAAFLHAGAVLDRPECNTLALKVLSRIWAEAS